MPRNFPKSTKKARPAARKHLRPQLEAGLQRRIEAYSPYLSQGLADAAPPLPTDNEAAQSWLETRVEALHRESAKLDTAQLMSALRQAKRKVSTTLALCDLAGHADDLCVMRLLSDFADACVQIACRHALREAGARKILRFDRKDPLKDSGLCILAVGKWGAHELNYSSDIDLMVIYDARRNCAIKAEDAQNIFIRLTREVARLLDQPTQDGYVFRTDFRLRPDPGAMPLAVSLETAEFYYGSLGQNWERAAMIKARPVAGDEGVARGFMKVMDSWIWRRNLDFAAIQDIHSIKRQINAKQASRSARKGGGHAFLDFNVKLGHGGIREIEFFAQTQQLIFGGRDMRLRAADTLGALRALSESGHVAPLALRQLTDAYLFLRQVEHRLQMQNDLQTHSLPATEQGLRDFADFAGYGDAAALTQLLSLHTGHVRRLYAGLFGESPALSQASGNLVFTGVEDDPETVATLRGMGFAQPETVTAAVRGWHHGRYRAMRSERARQILTEITPHLLQSLGQSAHPHEAFVRFDRFLSRLPSGIPIFSMFAKNPQQMELVAEIMGSAPALAEDIGTHPQVLEGVLNRDFYAALPSLASLRKDLGLALQGAADYEAVLDITRRWAREKRFHAGIHILKNLSPGAQAGAYLADIAEAVLFHLVPAVEKDFARLHGVIKGGRFMLLGMGSFAARRMYTDSDLDLVGLYVLPKDAASSDGQKSLPPTTYYIRLMQRLLTALSAQTAEGVLYETDTRLRPHGTDGPLAAEYKSFLDYHRHQSWVWEHMSLLRARVVYAPAALARKAEKDIAAILRAPRDMQKTRADMRDMREKMEKKFGAADPWNLKHARGGIVDIMFSTHALLLQHAHKHPDILAAPIEEALSRLRAKKLMTAGDYRHLAQALAVAEEMQRYLRLTAELPFDPAKASRGFKAALVRHVCPKTPRMSFAQFSRHLAALRRQSHAVYRALLTKR